MSKCKICGAESNDGLLDVSGVHDDYAQLINLDQSDGFKGYLSCHNCEVAFRDSYLSENAKEELYSHFRDEAFRNESLSEYFERITSLPDEKSENHEKIKWLSTFLNSRGNHVDIGGGVGVFSYAFKSYFDGWASVVIEPTPGIKDIASGYGVDVYCGYLNDQIAMTEKFHKKIDLITMNHVLEHIDNPIEILSLCKELLVENGMIYVETPSIKDIGFLPKTHDRFMSQHEVIFSQNALASLLQKLVSILSNLRPIYRPEKDGTKESWLRFKKLG